MSSCYLIFIFVFLLVFTVECMCISHHKAKKNKKKIICFPNQFNELKSANKEEIIYICVKESTYYFFYQHYKNHHAGKFNKTYLVNICFALPSRIVFWNLSFYFCFDFHKLHDNYTFIWKNIICHVSVFLWNISSFGYSGLSYKFIRRGYGFAINSKISSGDKPILTLKITVINFFRFWH